MEPNDGLRQEVLDDASPPTTLRQLALSKDRSLAPRWPQQFLDGDPEGRRDTEQNREGGIGDARLESRPRRPRDPRNARALGLR